MLMWDVLKRATKKKVVRLLLAGGASADATMAPPPKANGSKGETPLAVAFRLGDQQVD